MDKKRILHIVNSSARSNYLCSIAKLYDKSKFELIIGSLSPEMGPLQEEINLVGERSFFLPVSNIPGLFFSLFKLRKYIKHEKVDILHVHTFWVSLIGAILHKFFKVKVIMTRHHADIHQRLGKKFHSYLDYWTAKNVNKSIAVSQYLYDFMTKEDGVPPDKITVIHHGIEELQTTSKFNREALCSKLNIGVEDKMILCISRFHAEKNLETIIEALAELDRSFHLLLAGDGLGNDYFKVLDNKVISLGLRRNVHYLGFVNDIKDLMQVSDVLVHPSLGESFGFVVLEAMQQKLPVIASRIPATLEIATEEVALLFEPMDANDLKNKVIDTFSESNRKDLEMRLKKGFERYEKYFTMKEMVKKYEELYEEI